MNIETIEYLTYLFTNVIYAIVVIWYFNYLRPRRYQKYVTGPALGAFVFLLTTTAYFCFRNPFVNLIINALALLTVSLFYEDFKKTLVSLIHLEYLLLLSDGLVFYSMGIVTQASASELLESGWLNIGGLLFSKLIIVIVVGGYAWQFKSLSSVTVKIPGIYWIILLLIPLGTIYMFYYFQYIAMILESVTYHTIITICVSLLINGSVIVLFYKIIAYYNLKLENQKTIEQINILHQQQMLEIASYQSVYQIKHDLKNTLIALRSVVSPHNLEAIKKIDSMIGEVQQASLIAACGIPTIDSMINTKCSLSQRYGLNISFTHEIKGQVTVNMIDLGIILGSALDNAIEACKNCAGSTIHIDIAIEKNMVLLRIENPIYTSICRNHAGEICSTKPGNHGYGLDCIKKLVSKNHGQLVIDTDDNTFRLTVLLFQNKN